MDGTWSFYIPTTLLWSLVPIGQSLLAPIGQSLLAPIGQSQKNLPHVSSMAPTAAATARGPLTGMRKARQEVLHARLGLGG